MAQIAFDDPVVARHGALAVVWPDEVQTQILRSCLKTGPEAEQAWHGLVARIGSPKPYFESDLTGLKGLLPLIHAAARRNRFDIDRKMWTYLRSAALREELRYGVYRDLCRDVLNALRKADVPVIALKACAFAETVYSEFGERHCHAIDLLVPADSLERVADIIRPFTFRPTRIPEARPGNRQGFRHESGLPLVVHAALVDAPIYPGDVSALWASSNLSTVADVPVRTLAPAHNLLHVVTAAFQDRARGNLRWACDAWLLIRQMGISDWNEVLRYTQEAKLELPVLTMLRYLADVLEAPVPEDLFRKLEISARDCEQPSREAALSGAIIGRTTLRQIWLHKMSTRAARLELLRYLILPSFTFLRWRYGTRAKTLLPLFYVYRPLAFVAERCWWRMIELPGLNRFTRYRKIAAEMDRLRARQAGA